MNSLRTTASKEAKLEVLDDCLLIFRPDDLPQLLRPVRVMKDGRCAIGGKPIHAGDYVYPCHINPIRLAPHGTARCHITEAKKQGDKVLPLGYFAFKVPTTQALASKIPIEVLSKKRNDLLTGEVKKLLTGNKRR